jgi:ubiquinone/menaquinone biosynthesis C-methylase UbiE
MNKERSIYTCPETRGELRCVPSEVEGNEIISGQLINENGREYVIAGGIPDLTFPRELRGEQKEALSYYEEVADVYDDVAHLTFRIQNVDETKARQEFVSLLNLQTGSSVLELACGTGRDSKFIANELGMTGQFYLQDISRSMLLQCQRKLSGVSVPVEFVVGNACYLPFPDNYFDAVFSFGGLGVFGDITKSLQEIVRVSRVGAKIVVGDESMPPWLYETEYGKILLNSNPLFKKPIPFDQMPVEAREVVVRWVVGGVYYLIEFVVGEGEPRADFDLEIPGKRGGTLRTRFYGKLEGVKPETHELAQRARDKSQKTMHQWLDSIVREAAEKELCDSSEE